MRPKIICHMGSSIDGRLHPSRWTPPAAGIEKGLVHRYDDEMAARLDAEGWIVGCTTMAEIAGGHPRSPKIASGDLRRTHVGDRKGRDLAVAIDPHGKAHYGRDDAGGDHIVAILGEGVTDAYLTELREDGVSYLFAGPDGRDLAGAMERLRVPRRARRAARGGKGPPASVHRDAGRRHRLASLCRRGRSRRVSDVAASPSP